MRLLIFGDPTCPLSQALVKDVKACYQATEIKMINIYRNPVRAFEYDIRAVPTTVAVYDNGREIDRLIGNVGRQKLINWKLKGI